MSTILCDCRALWGECQYINNREEKTNNIGYSCYNGYSAQHYILFACVFAVVMCSLGGGGSPHWSD